MIGRWPGKFKRIRTCRSQLRNLRAAWWTAHALRQARRQLRRDGVNVRLSPPIRASRQATRGVYAILRRQPNTCLERALVLQRWLASLGEGHDVIVGVSRPGPDFEAHAWLDFERTDDPSEFSYQELLRLAPPT
jgi:hypothetical protein